MSFSLSDLSVSDLKRLGALRSQCSAPLACAEHGVPHPCELCELDGLRALTCSACGFQFIEGLDSVKDRMCASEAEFGRVGRIAFEAEAISALAAEQVEKEREREKGRERRRRRQEEKARERLTSEQIERERAEAERAARRAAREARRREETHAAEARLTEVRLAEERERERVRAEGERARSEAESLRETVERSIRETESLGKTRSGMAILCSALAAVVGAVMAWRTPLLPLPSSSWFYLLAHGSASFFVWLVGIASLLNSHPAHHTLRWWGFLPWSFFGFAWPAFGGMMFCYFLTEAFSGGAYFLSFFYLLVTGYIGIITLMHGGVAFSMEKPWPDAGVQAGFKGKRSWWLWVGVLLTMILNYFLWVGKPFPFLESDEINGAFRIISRFNEPSLQPILGAGSLTAKRNHTKASCIKNPDPVSCVSDQLARGIQPTAEDQHVATIYLLAQISKTVNAHHDLMQSQTQASLPIVDSSIKSISELPKPNRGDRAAARELLRQGLAMLNQQRRPAEAADLLGRAHQIDPLDVQIVNDLGYAQILANEFAEAEVSLVKALALAPKRSSAWASLAQLRIETAPNDSRSAEEASRYLVVAYWFSNDRSRMIKSLNESVFCTKGSAQSAMACKLALARIG